MRNKNSELEELKNKVKTLEMTIDKLERSNSHYCIEFELNFEEAFCVTRKDFELPQIPAPCKCTSI